MGSDKGSASSATLAAISGLAGNVQARTGDKEVGIAPIFDKDRVKQEVAAQVTITQEFGKQAPKAVGDYAGSQSKELNRQAHAETDPDKKAALQAEAARWDEGGAYRVALHVATGALVGGAPGALGAAAVASAAPLLEELQQSIQTALTDAGANATVAKLAGQLVAQTTAAGLGAAMRH